MKNSNVITFNDNEVTISELTVRQIRETLSRIDKADPQLIDELIDCPVPVLIITESTGISYSEMEECRPSQLKELAKAVVAVNPSFAAMIEKRVAAYQKMLEKLPSEGLTALSAA